MIIALQKKFEKKISEHKMATDISFSELIDLWLTVHKQSLKHSTYTIRSTHSRLFRKELDKVRTNKITAGILNRFLLSLFDNGRSYRTVEGYKQSLSSVLKFGAKLEYLPEGLVRALHLEKINVPKKNRDKYLEHEEISLLINNLNERKRYEFARICHIQILTGMRISELLAIAFEKQIDFEQKKIHITRQWIQSNKTFGSLKTGEPRTININYDVVYLIKEQIQVTRLKTMKYKCIDKSNTLLFMTRNGTPYDPHTVNKELKKIDINGKDVTTHYFRHNFVTLMIENNVPLHLIAQHVGHTNLTMIQEVYNHFNNKMDHDLSAAIESLSISI